MLASQLRPYKSGDGPVLSGSGASALRPTPHIIFHHLLASSNDSITPVVEMCVDGRSYGNEARFVWQSCQPNAEVNLFSKCSLFFSSCSLKLILIIEHLF
jgi:hypothetical protein